MQPILGFLELGLIVLAWTMIWQFIIKAWAGNHKDLPAAQGLAAVVN